MVKIMRKVMVFSTLIVSILTSPVRAADISGTWSITQKNNEGVDDTFDVEIKADGDKFTVTGNHTKKGALSGTGTLKGDAITMIFNAAGAEGKSALSFAYTGKITGNKMSGTKETKMSGAPGDGRQANAPGAANGGTHAASAGAVSNSWTAVKK